MAAVVQHKNNNNNGGDSVEMKDEKKPPHEFTSYRVEIFSYYLSRGHYDTQYDDMHLLTFV